MLFTFLEKLSVDVSKRLEDLKNIDIIPEQNKILAKKEWKIQNYWKKKLKD